MLKRSKKRLLASETVECMIQQREHLAVVVILLVL
jgi:hypothetical protein